MTRDKLCDLSATLQFRLCASIYDVRNQLKLSVNFTRDTGHRCMEGWMIEGTETGNTDERHARKYLTPKQRVDVVPCFVNRDYTPNFYLTSDPTQETSVYVLNTPESMSGNPTDGCSQELTLMIECRVNDVPVLKDTFTFHQ